MFLVFAWLLSIIGCSSRERLTNSGPARIVLRDQVEILARCPRELDVLGRDRREVGLMSSRVFPSVLGVHSGCGFVAYRCLSVTSFRVFCCHVLFFFAVVVHVGTELAILSIIKNLLYTLSKGKSRT